MSEGKKKKRGRERSIEFSAEAELTSEKKLAFLSGVVWTLIIINHSFKLITSNNHNRFSIMVNIGFWLVDVVFLHLWSPCWILNFQAEHLKFICSHHTYGHSECFILRIFVSMNFPFRNLGKEEDCVFFSRGGGWEEEEAP